MRMECLITRDPTACGDEESPALAGLLYGADDGDRTRDPWRGKPRQRRRRSATVDSERCHHTGLWGLPGHPTHMAAQAGSGTFGPGLTTAGARSTTRRYSGERQHARPDLRRRDDGDLDFAAGVTTDDDVATLAGQLADLTRVVEDLARQITAIRDRAVSQQEATDAQQERIELAARELADVSSRLQAAADALRTAI